MLIKELRSFFEKHDIQKKLINLDQTIQEPNFWNNRDEAEKILKEKKINLRDKIKNFSKISIGYHLLAPTKIYVKPILKEHSLNNIKACAHITGGGLIDNIPRIINEGYNMNIDKFWKIPDVFKWIYSITRRNKMFYKKCKTTYLWR